MSILFLHSSLTIEGTSFSVISLRASRLSRPRSWRASIAAILSPILAYIIWNSLTAKEGCCNGSSCGGCTSIGFRALVTLPALPVLRAGQLTASTHHWLRKSTILKSEWDVMGKCNRGEIVKRCVLRSSGYNRVHLLSVWISYRIVCSHVHELKGWHRYKHVPAMAHWANHTMGKSGQLTHHFVDC